MNYPSPKSDMLPRVILRADAGSRIGFGHFVRTVALASYLSCSFDCLVASRNPDLGMMSDYQRALLSDSGLSPLEIVGKTREEFDPAFLDSIRPDDIVVLDNYYYETEFQREVRSRCRALVCIDDMHDRHFVADLVMTFCPLTRDDFSLEPYTEFRGGMEWSFLREPFLAPAPARNDDRLPRRIALAMGGADPFRLTGKMVALLKEIDPSLELDILAGQTVAIDFEPDALTRVHRQVPASEIATIFDSCDLGIFPASTVCVEAFSRHLPVAAGYYVDNQEELYAYGVKQGWFAPLGSLLDDPADLLPRIRKVVKTPVRTSPDFDFPAHRRHIVELFQQLHSNHSHE